MNRLAVNDPMKLPAFWERADTVTDYASRCELQAPEESILGELRDTLTHARMLDIGVGGGRTTLHFSPLVREYVGVDSSENMIAACRQRFPADPDRVRFKVLHAQDLSAFADSYFDFVLFSYNGIDNLGHQERLRAIHEVHRVTKTDAAFAFSSHNLLSLRLAFRQQFHFHSDDWHLNSIRRILRWIRHRIVCGRSTQIMRRPYWFGRNPRSANDIHQYYVNPLFQIDQLEPWFRGICLYSLTTGQFLPNPEDPRVREDEWLYYLCRNKPKEQAQPPAKDSGR